MRILRSNDEVDDRIETGAFSETKTDKFEIVPGGTCLLGVTCRNYPPETFKFLKLHLFKEEAPTHLHSTELNR